MHERACVGVCVCVCLSVCLLELKEGAKGKDQLTNLFWRAQVTGGDRDDIFLPDFPIHGSLNAQDAEVGVYFEAAVFIARFDHVHQLPIVSLKMKGMCEKKVDEIEFCHLYLNQRASIVEIH